MLTKAIYSIRLWIIVSKYIVIVYGVDVNKKATVKTGSILETEALQYLKV